MTGAAEHGHAVTPGRSRWEIAAIWLWIAIFVGIAGRIGWFAWRGEPGRNNVYLKVFAEAGDAVLAQRDLYWLPSGERTGFRYPPLSALMFAPFAICGPVLGSILWRVVNFAVLWLGLRSCFRSGFPFALSSRERGVLLLLVVTIGITSLANGQPNALLLGLFLLATTGAVAGQSLGPAAGVTGGVALKIYPFAYGLVLGALQPRHWLWLLLGVLLVFGLPYLVLDAGYLGEQHRQLIELLRREDRTDDGLWNAYRNLRMVLQSFGLPMSQPVELVLQLGCAAAIPALCLWLRRLGATPRVVLDYAFTLTMCWFMLLGPATEKATYVLVSPCLVWPLLLAARQGRRGLFALFVLANVLAQLSLLPIDRDQSSTQVWRWAVLPYAVVLLTVGMGIRAIGDVQALRRRRSL